MELTKDEIQQIESYLVTLDVDYLDLKIELIDHITTIIENKMEKGSNFENAFLHAKLLMNSSFKERSDFIFGFQYFAPKIVLKKAVKAFRPFYVIYMVSYFLPFLFLTKYKVKFPQKTIFLTNTILKTVVFLALLSMLYIFYNLIKSKIKTTYKFIIKTQYLTIVLVIIPLFINNYFDEKGVLNGIYFGITLAGIATAYHCIYFYKKHLKVLQKIKTTNNVK